MSIVAENKDSVRYAYCQSGIQSRQASSMLQHMGYHIANNIGGIAAYSGKGER